MPKNATKFPAIIDRLVDLQNSINEQALRRGPGEMTVTVVLTLAQLTQLSYALGGFTGLALIEIGKWPKP